jgi:tetratricopeptide (TPR) repeat protein
VGDQLRQCRAGDQRSEPLARPKERGGRRIAVSPPLEQKNYDRAIELLTRALSTKLPPEAMAELWELRADAFTGKGDKASARRDYERAASVPPKDAYGHVANARIQLKLGKHSAALGEYRKAEELAPNDAQILNEVAWDRSTSPASGVRDGRAAVQAATKACELTKWNKREYIDTLAAAYAEAGDFAQAAAHQERALSKGFMSRTDRADYEKRLALYRQRKPYRDDRDKP